MVRETEAQNIGLLFSGKLETEVERTVSTGECIQTFRRQVEDDTLISAVVWYDRLVQAVRADEDDVERAEVVGTAFHDVVCFAI